MSDVPFVVSMSGDPHARRRREILHRYPQLRALMGFDRRTAAVIVLLVAAQLAIATWISRQSGFWGGFWGISLVAYFVGGVLNHWLAMGVHECSHHLAARTARGNRRLAIFANLPIPVPAAIAFIRYHIDHHTYLGIEKRDNDLPSRWEVRTMGRTPARKFLWLLFFLPITTFSRGFVNPPSRWERINIATQLTVNVVIVLMLGWKALAYLALSTLLGLGLHPVAAHWVHEHYLFEKGQETYSYYGALNWLTFNVGYHIEHHDLFNIPGWSLPKLKQAAPEFYDGFKTHPSWTLVLLRFIFDPQLTHASRISRSGETFKRAQSELRGLEKSLSTPRGARSA